MNPTNYTPLNIEHLEEGYSHHDTNAVNIALILIGTLTAGVLAVMLIVSIQRTMKENAPTATQPDPTQVELGIGERPPDTNMGTFDQMSPTPAQQPTTESNVRGATSIVSPSPVPTGTGAPDELLFEGGNIEERADPPTTITPGNFSQFTTPVVTPSVSPRSLQDGP